MARIARLEQREGSRTFAAWFGGLLRVLLFLAILVAAVGAGGWLYVERRIDADICLCVEEKLLDLLRPQGLRVEIGSARRAEGKGIELRKVRFHSVSEDGPFLEVDEVFLTCSTELAELVAEKIDVRHIDLRRPKLVAARGRDGSWNFTKLLLGHDLQATIPTLTIEDGRIEFRERRGGTWHSFQVSNVQLDVTPPPQENIDGTAVAARPLRIHGSLKGDHFTRGEVDASLAMTGETWIVKGSLNDLALSPALLDALPVDVSKRLTTLANLQGNLNLSFEVARDAKHPDGPRFLVAGKLANGRYEDPRLPAALTEIAATVRAANDELILEELTARCGQAAITFSLHSQGYTDDSPLRLTLQAENFELSEALVELLPERMQGAWGKFDPRGAVNADIDLTFDGQRWRPDIVLECLDVSFSYYRFPYRLERLRGLLRLNDTLLQSKGLVARVGDRSLRVNLQIQNPGEDYTGEIAFATDGPVPLDEKLLVALDEDLEKSIRTLRPRGAISVQGHFVRTSFDKPIDRNIDIQLHDCSVLYSGFAYPLDHVGGTLALSNGQWEFRDLHGQNDSAYISCSGRWNPASKGQESLELDFVVTDLALEDELKGALNPDLQRLWSNLRPRGTIDQITAAVRYSVKTQRLSMDINAVKWTPKQNLDGRSISIQPAWLPYQWDDVTGSIKYVDGEIDFRDLRAKHGRTTLLMSGTSHIQNDGGWQVKFNKIMADRLTIDQELLAALPSTFGQMASRINFSGPVGVQGKMELKGNGAGGIPTATWDLNFDVENGSVHCGVRLDQIRGGLQLAGAADERGFYSQGELDVHSVLCHDIQLTNIRGPVRIEPQRIVLGDFMANATGLRRAPRQVTARVFGGMVAVDAVVVPADDVKFDLQAVLTNADMSLISREAMLKKRDITGRANAVVRLQGSNQGTHTLRGTGEMHLDNADIYEVPVMVAMFKLLGKRRAEARTLTSCDANFNIQGDNLTFQRLDFSGDAITLKGSGEMTLDRQLKLQFYTIVGRDDFRVPIITPLLAEASRQLFEIYVEGSADDPIVRKQAVPTITDALRQMFPELAERAEIRQEQRAEGRGIMSRLPTPRQLLDRSGEKELR